MKKLFKSIALVVATIVATSSYAQLLDEKNVVITMDLQPVLQLKLEGPDQIDFTFNEIGQYYAGITKYGANVLKVSSSVSFDLWAVGLSQGNVATRSWDQQIDYQGGGASGVNTIPLTALELHQFPSNPVVAAAVATCDNLAAYTANMDYSAVFAPIIQSTGLPAAGTGNNCIYNGVPTTPYISPVVGATPEKYIAGGDGTGANCAVVGGSYLTETMDFAAGTPNAAGYYFVMDYRIVPGLPAVFPMHLAASNANATSPSLVAADLIANDGDMGTTAGVYAAPGVYSMYIKYILAEDQ